MSEQLQSANATHNEKLIVNDYRVILKEAFEKKKKSSSKEYSLRAYAKELGVSFAHLSEVLNYRSGLSRKSAGVIADKLGIKSDEKDFFCDLVSAQHARGKREREEAQRRVLSAVSQMTIDQGFRLQNDAFKIVSDWYHLGIMQLTKLKDFNSDSHWIARRLGISHHQVVIAIDRLVRLGLMRWDQNNLVLIHDDGYVPNAENIPSSSIRKFHRQVIEKGLLAIERQKVSERFLSTNFIAISNDDIPEAQKEIDKFSEKLSSKFESTSKGKDKIYSLAIQFFAVTGEVK